MTKDQLAVLQKLSLPLLPALSHEIPEHALRVGRGESPLLDQYRRQDPPNSHGQASALTEMRAEQSGGAREPGIVAQALNGVTVLLQGGHICLSALPFSRALLLFGGGACPMSFAGSLQLSE